MGAAILTWRALALWLLGYADTAREDVQSAIENAREIGHAVTSIYVLSLTSPTLIFCGNYATALANLDEVVALAEEKGALPWKANGMALQGCVLALTDQAEDALKKIATGVAILRETGSKFLIPLFLSYLGRAHAGLGQFDDARRCIGEAITTVQATKERWCEAEIYRVAGEIALHAPGRNAAQAQEHFERALAIARQQQARSWELRVAMSMARLWREQDRQDAARNLLAPIYDWFTEGFDTIDLKEAKELLDV